MISSKQGDICKSHSYNGFEEQKTRPSLSCENSRPASTSAHYNDDLNSNYTNNQTNQAGNQIKSNNDQLSNSLSQIDKIDNELAKMDNQARVSNEELSTDDNLISNQNESSTNDDAETNVPNYLLLADEQNKAESTIYFAPKHGLQHTALGFRVPNLINTFQDEALEFAYQLYSMRQRHQPLMIINFINFLLTLVLISLPIFLVYEERANALNESVLTFELLKLISIGISINLHLILPSIIILLITIFYTHCANHHLHYVGYITFAITVFLSQLIEKGQLHLTNNQIDFLLFDKFDNKPIHTIDSHSIRHAFGNASLSASLSSSNLIKNTTNLFLSQNTWYLIYLVFVTYVILPLSLKWSAICSMSCLLLDLLLTIFKTQHEHVNCTQNFNLIVSNFHH